VKAAAEAVDQDHGWRVLRAAVAHVQSNAGDLDDVAWRLQVPRLQIGPALVRGSEPEGDQGKQQQEGSGGQAGFQPHAFGKEESAVHCAMNAERATHRLSPGRTTARPGRASKCRQ
jgi:hypothetical protein